MGVKQWQELLEELETQGRKSHFVDDIVLDDFETQSGFKLPITYRNFCNVFGSGTLCDLFEVAVPGYTGKRVSSFDLLQLHKWAREARVEYDEYCPNVCQFERAFFFARDIISGIHVFWDLEEIIDLETYEYCIYCLHRDWEIVRLADNFWQFAVDVCLKNSCKLYDEPNEPTFVFSS